MPGVRAVCPAYFWRALAADPERVGHFADWPVNECDLQARHRWLTKQTGFREKMLADPDFYDAKIAGTAFTPETCLKCRMFKRS